MQTVLLIDDDVELVEMLKEYIEQENFSVLVAHDGMAGAQMLLEQPFDIVVLDVMMPRLNGIETLKAIRQHSNVPVIMLTGNGDKNIVVECLKAGANDYIVKPVSAERLHERLQRFMPQAPVAPL